MLTYLYFAVLPSGRDVSGTVSALSRLDAERMARFRHPNATGIEVMLDEDWGPSIPGMGDMRF